VIVWRDAKSNDDAFVHPVEDVRVADALRVRDTLLEFARAKDELRSWCMALIVFDVNGAVDELVGWVDDTWDEVVERLSDAAEADDRGSELLDCAMFAIVVDGPYE
jgi:hypothetical protein